LLAFRLTDSVLAAGIAGLIYAVTPQLVSETRNLNGRAFASLLQTLAMLALLRSAIPSEGPTSLLLGQSNIAPTAVAAVLIALLYNTHTSTTIAFIVSAATLTLVTGDPRFIALAVVGLPLAIVLSGGYYLRVIQNHLYAARFWMRNVRLTRAHQIDDSPILGPSQRGAQAGLYAPTWRSRLALVVRVLGENPFILAMLATPIPENVWAFHMYWWAVAILIWSVLTTFGGPLRILGPGFHYMKASVFPSAYTLAVTVNMREGGLTGFDVMLLISFLASFGALAYFFRVMDMRQTEQTAQTPPDLARATEYLREQPEGSVLVLPNMFADFVMYNSGKPVVWGGHSGNLARLEEFFPVIRQPLSYFFERYHVVYVVVDQHYTTLDRLQIGDATELLEQFAGRQGGHRSTRAADRVVLRHQRSARRLPHRLRGAVLFHHLVGRGARAGARAGVRGLACTQPEAGCRNARRRRHPGVDGRARAGGRCPGIGRTALPAAHRQKLLG
jgi:hypothetical protein